MIKLKYLPLLSIAFLFAACQSDPTPDQMGQQHQPPMEGQMQQPAMNTDVTDQELDQFLEVSVKAREIQMGFQEELTGIIEDEGLAVETYIQIAEGLQMGQPEEDINVSDEDLERFQRASANIEDVGARMDDQMAVAIEEEGMSMERFQELNMAIQQDPGLQQRLQEKMMVPEMQ